MLRVQLPHLEDWARGRREAAEHYVRAGLGGIEGVALPVPVAGAEPAWHLYVIGHPDAVRLEGALNAAGVGCRGYYRTPVHRQAAMREWGAGLELGATEAAAGRHLAIPMSPVLSAEQAAEVVAAIAAIVAAH